MSPNLPDPHARFLRHSAQESYATLHGPQDAEDYRKNIKFNLSVHCMRGRCFAHPKFTKVVVLIWINNPKKKRGAQHTCKMPHFRIFFGSTQNFMCCHPMEILNCVVVESRLFSVRSILVLAPRCDRKATSRKTRSLRRSRNPRRRP